MLSYWVARTSNGLRKVAAGLKPFSESVWPGVRNDLFVAHESIYSFFETLCTAARVVDAGCGTGYGSYRLAQRAAREVTGVDIDERNIRFAKAHYIAPNLRFRVGDIHHLDSHAGAADAVVASNAVEHLERPEEFLRSSHRVASRGFVAIAVPPIFTAADTAAHSGIHYHRSNLSVREWLSLFEAEGWAVQCFAHRVTSAEVRIDFASPFQSPLTTSDFAVEESSPKDLYEKGAITAVFVLRREG